MTTAIRTALRRPRGELWLFVRALGVVLAVRLALWLLPARLLLRWVRQRVLRAQVPADAGPRVRRIGWAVRAAARRVPQASCLTQALAVQLLLAQEGYSSHLKIGVARDGDSGLAAHAWVLVDGRVLVGGNVRGFRELPDIMSSF